MAETDELPASKAAETQAVGTMQSEGAAVPAAEPAVEPEAPATPAAPPPHVTPPLARPVRSPALARRRRRLRLAGNLAIAMAAIVAAILLAWPVPPAQPARPAVVLLLPRGDGVECARDAEWAPDSTRLAVLGYTQRCPEPAVSAAQPTGTMLVYNALTGSLISRIHPDTLIARAVSAPPGSAIEYNAAVWSPNGKRLAVSFGVTAGGSAVAGIYLCDADGSHAKVLVRSRVPGDTTAGMWDLQTGAYVPAPSLAPLPPALSYQWDSSGSLSAAHPLSAATTLAAPPLSAIGSPDGSASFSVWQPAAITLRSAAPASQPAPDGAYVLSTSFAVWSPDGRYLIPNAGMQARILPADAPAPSQATLTALGLAATPVLPVRDHALQVALDRLSALAPDERGNSPMLAAWSPDGRLLAVQLVPSELSDVPHISHHALMIYDCATGKALIALTPDDADTSTEGPTFVRWSPNGARLMLFDNQMGTLTIFGRSKIPHS